MKVTKTILQRRLEEVDCKKKSCYFLSFTLSFIKCVAELKESVLMLWVNTIYTLQ